MNKHVLPIVIGLLLLLAAGSVIVYRNVREVFPGVYCFGPPRDEGLRPIFHGELLPLLEKNLNLSDEQFSEIKKLDVDIRTRTHRNRAMFPALMRSLKNEMFKNSMDKKKIGTILEEMDALKRKERAMIFETVFRIRSILTPGQRELFDSDLKKRFEGFIVKISGEDQRAHDRR